MPTAATTTLSQHCAVTQVSAVNTCQQSDAVTRGDGAVTQLVTQKLTEQGQIILLNDSLAICKFLLSLASVDWLQFAKKMTMWFKTIVHSI